ncbi:hypothetical protein EJB05_30211, partial [Eragrostis curvula]
MTHEGSRRGGRNRHSSRRLSTTSRQSTPWEAPPPEPPGPLRRHLADATYAATGLPRKVPILALIHPKARTPARVVYFSLHARLFAVDVQARKVLHCEPYNLVAPPQEYMANRFLRAWDLPRAVSSGMVNWSNGMSLMSETAACTSSALC